MTPALLDTGVIVALLDRSEHKHLVASEALESHVGPLVTCEAVITESCYLLRNLPGAVEAVLENVRTGVFRIPVPLAPAAGAIQKIIRKYRDRQVDLADACLVHLASELKTGEIWTLDGDFRVYRWGANKPFRFLLEC